jgi:hypothetical protein
LATVRVLAAIGEESAPWRLALSHTIEEIHAVLSVLIRGVRVAATRAVGRIGAVAGAVTRPAPVVLGLLRDLTRSRKQLVAENALLRQQLIVAARTTKRPRLAAHERGLLVLLARLVPRWWEAVLLVKPEAILRWHREGFRLFWRRKSKSTSRRPQLSAETIALIRRMAE